MTDVNTVASIVWSVFGLIAGYGIGYYHRSVKGKRATPMSTTPPADPPVADPQPARRREGPGAATRPTHATPAVRDRSSLARTIAGLVILALTAATLFALYRTTSCQAGYNAAVTRSLSARSDQTSAQLNAAIEQLDAQLDLLAPYPPDAPIADQRAEGMRRTTVYRDAAAANRKALIELRDARATYPIPAADSCGEPKP